MEIKKLIHGKILLKCFNENQEINYLNKSWMLLPKLCLLLLEMKRTKTEREVKEMKRERARERQQKVRRNERDLGI